MHFHLHITWSFCSIAQRATLEDAKTSPWQRLTTMLSSTLSQLGLEQTISMNPRKQNELFTHWMFEYIIHCWSTLWFSLFGTLSLVNTFTIQWARSALTLLFFNWRLCYRRLYRNLLPTQSFNRSLTSILTYQCKKHAGMNAQSVIDKWIWITFWFIIYEPVSLTQYVDTNIW